MTVVLLHDLGDPVGGARWRSAAPPDWIIPDLPGHGLTPAVRTGHYDPMSAVAIARWTLARQRNSADTSTLVGVGCNAHPALIGAARGDCDRVVVVDGLWAPWRLPAEEIDAFYAMIRAIAADPAATAPPPASGLDPRAGYGYGVMSSARFAQRFWATIDQPVLAIETPRSTTPRDERAERLAWFGGAKTLVELDAADAATVVDAIRLGVQSAEHKRPRLRLRELWRSSSGVGMPPGQRAVSDFPRFGRKPLQRLPPIPAGLRNLLNAYRAQNHDLALGTLLDAGVPWRDHARSGNTRHGGATYDPMMADASHPNVDVVRRAFAAMETGDMAAVLEIFSPDLAYFGADQLGRFRSFDSRDEFFGMVIEGMALNNRFENELVDAFAVGDSLVMTHVRGHRSPASDGVPMTFDYVMALRLEGGVVTRATDLIDANFERYCSSLG